MPQCVRLDRQLLLVYLGVAGWACRNAPGPEPLLPVGAQPVSRPQVLAWVDSTRIPGHQLYRFKWLFRDERGSAGGRGSARIAPPDSLRFDVAGPFGSGAASAVVVGDQALWMEPPDVIAKLVPNYPLMWAMFGITQEPPEQAALSGISNDRLVAWQYAGPTDTVVYALSSGDSRRLVAEVHQSGSLIGRAETTFKPDGVPLKSRLTVPSGPAQLDLTFLSTEQASFAPEIWLPRKH
jgi:hypothetical protein